VSVQKRDEKGSILLASSYTLCLTRLLVLHDGVGEGAMRFGFDGRLGGYAWVLGWG
jgi:hypothetical protein